MDVCHAQTIVNAVTSRCGVPFRDRDDARQEGYLGIIQKPKGDPYLAAWNAVSHYRTRESRARRRLLSGRSPWGLLIGRPQGASYDFDDRLDLCDLLMTKLTNAQRAVLSCRYWQNMTWNQVGQAMHCRVSSAKLLETQALTTLRASMKGSQ